MEAQLLEYRRKKEKERKAQYFSINKLIHEGVAKFFTNSTKSGPQIPEAEVCFQNNCFCDTLQIFIRPLLVSA